MSLRKAVPSLFLLVFSIALLPFQAYADEASRRVKVEELFKLTHLEQTYGQIMTQVMAQTEQMTKQMFPEGNISDAQKKQLADFQTRSSALVKDSFSWEAMKPDYVKLYSDLYTEEDLDGIITFYRSPAGQAMLTKTPVLLKKSSEIAMNRMTVLQPKLQQMIEDFRKQVQQNGSGTSQ